MEKKTVALLSAVFALCACAAWASVAGDGKTSAAEVERVKASAEKGDAAAQFRYAEMLRAVPDGAFYMNGLGVDRDEDKAVEWPSRFSPVPPPKATQVLRRNLKSLELKPRSEVGKVRILQTSKGA